MDEFIALFRSADTYISLLTLTFLEIVLGIDNVIFISIVTGRVEPRYQRQVRTVGLSLALLFRILLLMAISYIVHLTQPLVEIGGFALSARDLILLAGGLFLVAKSTIEIHHRIEGEDENRHAAGKAAGYWPIVGQIIVLDVVFSFDSVITAVGLVSQIPIMIIAVVLSLFVMLAFAAIISDFVNRYPTVKMLALSFLLMIGMLLFAEGFHLHVPRGYVYFAMAFSLAVEFLNIKAHKHQNKAAAH